MFAVTTSWIRPLFGVAVAGAALVRSIQDELSREWTPADSPPPVRFPRASITHYGTPPEAAKVERVA
ncbi:hypothetical protein EPO04_00090 [Patescibacteria group bacterium]|nr:MAG: hypothetical protein EPO04_00090 [Patescibacteria group bacterium]